MAEPRNNPRRLAKLVWPLGVPAFAALAVTRIAFIVKRQRV